jgi:hypothetical protein
MKTPHEMMTQHDRDGDSYVVSISLQNGERIGPFPALANPDPAWLWLDQEDDGGALIVNMRHVATIKINVI